MQSRLTNSGWSPQLLAVQSLAVALPLCLLFREAPAGSGWADVAAGQWQSQLQWQWQCLPSSLFPYVHIGIQESFT